jgi:hypothetical protein
MASQRSLRDLVGLRFSSPIFRRDVGKAGPGNGGIGAINKYFRAAIRSRSHRTVDRIEVVELGPSPGFATYHPRAIGPRGHIRGNKRSLFARCGATA